MGVRGLQTFLKNNPDLLIRIDLSNTDLVIDANNLLCQLFTLLSKQDKNDLYGGNLVAYGTLVRTFFENLKKCNIRPILVFDGSVIGKQSTQDKILLKTNTVYKRGLDRFNSVKNLQEYGESDSSSDYRTIIPLTINHVFKCIAIEMGIRRIQTPYEADAHIARLANELACPVLTNDSDFLVFDIPNGYIMIDMFQFLNVRRRNNEQDDAKAKNRSDEAKTRRNKELSNFSIPCFILTQRRFMRYFPGMLSVTMPLLSILLGNDYVEAFTFDKLCDKVAIEQYRGPLVANSFAHRKILRILHWLSGKTPIQAIEQLVYCTSNSDKPKIRSVLNILLRNYNIEDSDNFIAELNEVYPPATNEINQSAPTETPAEYLKRLTEQCTLSPVILDMSFHNPYFNYPIIDDFIMPSSNIVKYRSMSVCLTLLRSHIPPPNATTIAKMQQSQLDTLEIWDRINGKYDKKIIYPCLKLERFGSLEHLNIYALIGMDPSLKKSLFLETFHSSLDELNLLTDSFRQIISPELSRQAGLILMLVRYASVETCLKAKPQFVEAIFLSLIYYAIVNKDKKLKQTIDGGSLKKICTQISPLTVMVRTSPTPMEQMYRRIMHFISQLQSSIVSYECLNTLLDSPLSMLTLEQYMNCVLIFNLTKCLRLEKLKTETILGEPDCTGLLDCCNLVKTLVDVQQ